MLPLAGFLFAAQLLVVVVHGFLFLSCDIVELLVSLFIPQRWLGSLRWNVGCFGIWLLVLGSVSPLLCQLLKQPLVILWSQAGLAVSIHRYLVRGDGDGSSEGEDVWLSTKLYKRFNRQRTLSCMHHRHGAKGLYQSLTFGGLLLCYVTTRVHELMQTPLRSAIMSVYMVRRLISLVRTSSADSPIVLWKLLGTVSPLPVLDCDIGEDYE